MIRTMAGVIGVPVASAAAFVTMSPSGEVHDMDRFTAYTTLKAMSFDRELGRDLRRSSGGVRVTGVPGQEVVWTVSALGGKVATVRAELEVVDAGHTRVTMTHHAYDHPDPTVNTDLIRAVVRYGLEEKIDATLDGRPFDAEQLRNRLASYVVSNPGSVAELQRSVTAEASSRQWEVREEMTRETSPMSSTDPAEAVREREREEGRRMREASAPMLRP